MVNVSLPPDNSFFDEFIDDFFAECDEHLTAVRRNLFALEPFVEQAEVDRALLEELFRSFHSLKGLAGMVGVSDVEQLAHHTESYFRALRDKQVVLSAPVLDALFEATRLIEQALAAWQRKEPGPVIEPVVAALNTAIEPHRVAHAAAAPVATSSTEDAPLAAQPASTAGHTQRSVRFVFVPTTELAERGINVNTIRARLQAIGEIQQAIPRVRPEGGVAFEFIVATAAQPAAFEPLTEDGVEWQLDEPNGVTRPATNPVVAANSPLSVAPANIVRVDLARLDELMQMIGDLVITRARLAEQLAHLEQRLDVGEWRDLQDTNLLLWRQLRDLREGVVRTRMVPMGDIFARMQFVVRDLARDLNKQVRLEISGQHTEIDKYIVERLFDPLVHLVRNAVDHGLEPPAERVAQGKPAEGTLSLSASARGDVVTIELADDGRGINAERLRARARELGVLTDSEPLDDARILDVLCTPGFSTREQADHVSGRGVGMDVVQRTIHQLGGILSLTTEVGRGTCFTMQVALTLTIVDALIVSTTEQMFAIPLPAVREVIEIDADAITALENNELVRYRERVLPLMRLPRVFSLHAPSNGAAYGLVLGQGPHALVLGVDRVLDKREIVVRPISDPLVQVMGIGGATELGDGRVVLILDPVGLVQLARDPRARPAAPPRRDTDGKSSSAMQATPTATEPYILFELAGTTYGVHSGVVQHIDMLEQITPIPNASPMVEGIVHVRGQLVPALNLRARFGLPKIPYDLRTRLVVIQHDERRVGLVVDTAREFVRMPADAFQPPPEAVSGLSGNYLDHIATLGDRLVLILNLSEVLSLPETSLPTLEDS